ncbi:MAG: ParB/RepB/Spo0J family partition protein, partial [Eubacteriales bacterium]|nr:ParB/RepB/Spo0J family partition protein [Eubacteriales bacterium]
MKQEFNLANRLKMTPEVEKTTCKGVKSMILGEDYDVTKEEIVSISLDLIDTLQSFEHPFEKSSKRGLLELSEKIRISGVLEPVILRTKENGRYELLAGHRRTKASIIAGFSEIPAIIKNCDDDVAKIIATDTNLGQREEILPSERAKAYQIQMEALRHQGKRTDLTGNLDYELNLLHNVQQVKTSETVAELNNTSARQIAYYLRLLNLIPSLLDLVDEKIIPLRAGADLSYLTEEEQAWVAEALKDNEKLKISLKIAADLKLASA